MSKISLRFPKITFWRVVLLLILAAGFYATVLRFTKGLGATTNLSAQFPWGIWIGFDVLCGVALAAGGFSISAVVYIFHIEKYRPIVRPAILTAFLGYSLVCVGLMFDLGRPYNIWHPLIMWNPHSVMFEVGWCVTLYTTVLMLEFSPLVLEKLPWKQPYKIVKSITIPLVILGVLLSTMHQSSLGTLYLIVPHKLHPLWYSPLMPVFFFISAIALGCAMTIFESYLSLRAFRKHLDFELLTKIGAVGAVTLLVYLVIRVMDMQSRGVAVLPAGDSAGLQFVDTTTVYFRALSDAEIDRYIALEQPFDCAGGFRCEALGISLFSRVVSEDPTGLVGLPLIALARSLRQLGYELP